MKGQTTSFDMKRRVNSVSELKYHDYVLIQSIGGTDIWAIGRVHSVSDGELHINYNDDEIQSISVALVNEGCIYVLNIFP